MSSKQILLNLTVQAQIYVYTLFLNEAKIVLHYRHVK